MYFHTDIARDFLILEDIYYGHHISLLGPRAGGIEGVFHGPLWFYLNLPAYIIGHGNPIIVGWFWIILYIALIIGVYIIGRKVASHEVGYIAASLVAVQAIDMTKMLLNPYGAVLVAPFIFYFLYQYIRINRVIHLLAFIFLTGLAIQFEMAFGLPILFLGAFYALFNSIKTKKFVHLLSYFVLVIPLSTYIIFDVRHQFLQSHAVISYITQHKGGIGYNLTFLWSRVLRLLDVTNMFAAQQSALSLIAFVMVLYMLFIDRKRNEKLKDPLWLFVYLYVGFSVISFILFKGEIQSYYTMPFLPVFAVVFVTRALTIFYRPFVYLLVLVIFIFGVQKAMREMFFNSISSLGDGSTWQFNMKMATHIYDESTQRPFGYYVYTPDLFGYGPRYAMNYMQRQRNRLDVYPYLKKDILYLIISPAPFHSALGPEDWKKNEVKINRSPDKKITYPNGYIVEMYRLTEEEQKIQSNQNMIQSVIMR